MKKDLIKSTFIILLLTFSFYYAKKISNFLIYKSNLMKEILTRKEDYEKDSIDAIINGNYITPGISGSKVSNLESYYQMKADGIFNEEKIVYEEVKPNISILDNQSFIINKANSFKRKVSLIFKDNSEIEKYLLAKQIKVNKLVTLENYQKKSFFEQINYDKDYLNLEKLMEENSINNNLCFLNNYNKEYCLKNLKFLIEPTYVISDSTLIKANINAGDIIMLDNNLSLSSFKILLQKIAFQDLQITTLSDLISEKR